MGQFFDELKRRNIFRVGIAYLIVAWLIAQVTEIALDSFAAPDWVLKTVLFLLVIGFPLALLFAWAFELAPDGIKLEKDVVRSGSITHITGRELFSWPVRDMKDKRHTDSELKPRKNYSCIGKFT